MITVVEGGAADRLPDLAALLGWRCRRGGAVRIWRAGASSESWLDRSFFEKVHVSPYGSVAWSEDVELCEDALYLRLTGKSVEEVMPAARLPRIHA